MQSLVFTRGFEIFSLLPYPVTALEPTQPLVSNGDWGVKVTYCIPNNLSPSRTKVNPLPHVMEYNMVKFCVLQCLTY
jgi:hypothetical protein